MRTDSFMLESAIVEDAVRPLLERTDSKGPMRVLMIVESSAGGTGRHVLDLSQGLIGRGCEVHLVHSTRRIDTLFRDRLAQLPSIRSLALPIPTGIHPQDIAIVRRIRRYIRECGPFDIIHGHSSKGGALARLSALRTGAVAIYTLHGLIMMDPDLPRLKKLSYSVIELALSLWTKRIIAVSPEEQRAARALGLGQARISMIPNGVDAIDLRSRAAGRCEMGVADDNVVIGFVGRLVEQKAVHVLIKAFARLAVPNDRACLALIGAGPLRDELEQLSHHLKVHDRVLWLGERDAREMLSAFDLFAISSRKEGLPYVVLEAMAAGLPVVATSSSGVKILIERGISGEIVPTDDADAFARALTGLADDPEKRRRFAAAARERCGQFTIDAMVGRTFDVYRDALSARRRLGSEGQQKLEKLPRGLNHRATEPQRSSI